MEHYVNFKEELQQRTAYAEEVIRKWLPEEEGFALTMAQAMNYSMCAGGKRLRPILLLETFCLFGGEGEVVEPFMAGIEMIHTHSLIRSDLPAIDNGITAEEILPHTRFTEKPWAFLSGVSLLNYAYETMLRAFSMTEDSARVIRALRIMADRTGIHGMLGGQSVDVKMTANRSIRQRLIISMKQTSALLEASMMTGAVLAGADEEQTKLIRKLRRQLVLHFRFRMTFWM